MNEKDLYKEKIGQFKFQPIFSRTNVSCSCTHQGAINRILNMDCILKEHYKMNNSSRCCGPLLLLWARERPTMVQNWTGLDTKKNRLTNCIPLKTIKPLKNDILLLPHLIRTNSTTLNYSKINSNISDINPNPQTFTYYQVPISSTVNTQTPLQKLWSQ